MDTIIHNWWLQEQFTTINCLLSLLSSVSLRDDDKHERISQRIHFPGENCTIFPLILTSLQQLVFFILCLGYLHLYSISTAKSIGLLAVFFSMKPHWLLPVSNLNSGIVSPMQKDCWCWSLSYFYLGGSYLLKELDKNIKNY